MLLQETEEARVAIAETFRTVQRLLAVVAVGDDDLIDPSTCDSLGPATEALEARINQMRVRLDSERVQAIEGAQRDADTFQSKIDELSKVGAELMTRKCLFSLCVF